MDRRDFLTKALATFAGYQCSCSTRWAHAASRLGGCRRAAGGGDATIKLLASSGDASVDETSIHYARELMKHFAVRPGVKFYDDANGLNALATPDVLSDGDDGTILLGVNLLRHEIERVTQAESAKTWSEVRRALGSKHADTGAAADDATAIANELARLFPPAGTRSDGPAQSPDELKEALNKSLYWYKALLVVMAHEFGHIVQYKKGLRTDGPWQMEPHADYLAGWALGRIDRENETALVFPGAQRDKAAQPPIMVFSTGAALAAAVRTMFDKGDTDFSDASHHGHPELRAAAVRAGYEASRLDLDAAFAEGRKLAKLD